MKRATGLGGVFFRSKDPGRTAKWYAKHLGLPVSGAEHGSAMWIFEWRPPQGGAERGITVWAAFPSSSKYLGRRTQQLMINYRVADLHALLQKLRKEGVWVDPKIEESAYGKFGWVRDVDGRRVELWEPPGAKPRARRRRAKTRRARRS